MQKGAHSIRGAVPQSQSLRLSVASCIKRGLHGTGLPNGLVQTLTSQATWAIPIESLDPNDFALNSLKPLRPDNQKNPLASGVRGLASISPKGEWFSEKDCFVRSEHLKHLELHEAPFGAANLLAYPVTGVLSSERFRMMLISSPDSPFGRFYFSDSIFT